MGVYLFPKLSNREKYVLILVSMVTVADLLALNVGVNTWFYNISLPLIQLAVLLLYRSYFSNKLLRGIIAWAVGFLLVFSALNYTRWQGSDVLNTFNLAVGGLFISAISYLLLRDFLFRSETDQHILIALTLGNLAYYTISTVTFSSFPVLIHDNLNLAKHFMKINDGGYLMWGIIILIGFIWKIRT